MCRYSGVGLARIFVISLDERTPRVVESLLATKATSQPSCSKQLGQIPSAGDAFVLSADIDAIGRWVAQGIREHSDGDQLMIVKDVLTLLGLDGVNNLLVRVGMKDSDFVSDVHLKIDQPLRGAFKRFRPVDVADFEKIDASASQAEICNIDIAGLFDDIVGAVSLVEPEASAKVSAALGSIKNDFGIDIRNGLIDALAGPMMMIEIPAMTLPQLPYGGFAITLELSDPDAFKETMLTLEQTITPMAQGKMVASTQPAGKRTAHVWTIPQAIMFQIMPARMIEGRTFIISTHQMISQMTAERIGGDEDLGPALPSTENFRKMTADLPANPIHAVYADFGKKIEGAMIALQPAWFMLIQQAKQQGIDLPTLLPPASDLSKHIGPAIAYSWFDETGLRIHGEGPMPVAGQEAIAAGAAGTAVLLPALSRSRELARRSMAASNMRQFVIGSIGYAQDHEGGFPATLEELIESKLEGEEALLISPRKPKGFDGPSYIYIPGQTMDSHPENILLYENPAFSTEGLNVAYVDGHIAWLSSEEFFKDLHETYDRLGKEMPKTIEVRLSQTGRRVQAARH